MTIFLYANNAKSALAGSITDTAVTANLTSGSGVLFPSPSTGQQFALTFVDAATGLLREIVYVTARSGDTITMVRGQEGTTALNWSAGDIAASLVTAGNMTAAIQPGQTNYSRIRLLSATTFHVSLTGNDATGDGTVGNPWATFAHAVIVVSQNYDINGHNVTFLSDSTSGTYTNDYVNIYGFFTGQTGQSIILYDFNGCSIQPASGINAVSASAAAQVRIRRVKFIGNSGTDYAAASGGGGLYLLDGIEYTTNSTGRHIGAFSGGIVNIQNSYTISGGAIQHYTAGNSGSIYIGGTVTVTLTGTPTFNIFVEADHSGTVTKPNGTTFTGAANGTRYYANMNGTIDTNGGGANAFPGSIAGTTTLGGQYN